jgi:hypothetical protein
VVHRVDADEAEAGVVEVGDDHIARASVAEKSSRCVQLRLPDLPIP